MWSTLKKQLSIRGKKRKSASRESKGPLARPYVFPTKPDVDPEPEEVEQDEEAIEPEDPAPASGDEEPEEVRFDEEDKQKSSDEEPEDVVRRKTGADDDRESECSDVDRAIEAIADDTKDGSTSDRSDSVRSDSTDEKSKRVVSKKTITRKVRRSESVLEEITEDREASLVKPTDDNASLQSFTDDESKVPVTARVRFSIDAVHSKEDPASEDDRSSVDWSYQGQTDDESATEFGSRRSAESIKEIKIDVDQEVDLDTPDHSEARASKESIPKDDVPSIRISKDFISKIIFVDEVKDYGSGPALIQEEAIHTLEVTIKEILPVKEVIPVAVRSSLEGKTLADTFALTDPVEEPLPLDVEKKEDSSLKSPDTILITISSETGSSGRCSEASEKKESEDTKELAYLVFDKSESDIERDSAGLESPKSEEKQSLLRPVVSLPRSKRKLTGQSDLFSETEALDEEIQGLLEEIDEMLESKPVTSSKEELQSLLPPKEEEESSTIESPMIGSLEALGKAQKYFSTENAGAEDSSTAEDFKSVESLETADKFDSHDDLVKEAGETFKDFSYGLSGEVDELANDAKFETDYLKSETFVEFDDRKIVDVCESSSKRVKTEVDIDSALSSKNALEAGDVSGKTALVSE